MNRLDLPRAPGRREFLRNTAGAAALALLDWPTAAMAWTASRPSPVRVRGVVRTPFGGLHGVAVTDGLSVVDTAADGSYELITTRGRPFVHVSLPAGHRVPVNATGTANFYRPIAVNGAEAKAVFDLEPLEESDDRHAFLVLADIQTEDAIEMAWFHEQTVPDVQATLGGVGRENVFGLALGDIMFDHLELFPEFERGVSRMWIPFFQVDRQSRRPLRAPRAVSRHHPRRSHARERAPLRERGPRARLRGRLRGLVERADLRGRHAQRVRGLRGGRRVPPLAFTGSPARPRTTASGSIRRGRIRPPRTSSSPTCGTGIPSGG
jgi:hypothetical protein